MNKPSLLLLHGAIGAKTQFEPWIPLLEPYFNCHTLDFKGHGKDSSEALFSIPIFAEQVIQYIKNEITEPIYIFGYSMGGYVGLYIAQQYPNKINRLFTFATKLAWSTETAEKEIKMLNPDMIVQKVPKFAQELEKRHIGTSWQQVLQKTASMMTELGKNPLITEESVKNISIPVQMGVGDKDTMVSIEETLNIYKNIPNGNFCVLPNTLHPVEKINTELLIPLIKKFFD
jgi:pimeloyl-ACP methyl ester carboxylesterase